MDKLNPKAFVTTRVISSDFRHRQKSIGITRLLLFRQKSRLLANKAKQVFKAFLSGKSSEEIARELNIPLEEVEDLVM